MARNCRSLLNNEFVVYHSNFTSPPPPLFFSLPSIGYSPKHAGKSSCLASKNQISRIMSASLEGTIPEKKNQLEEFGRVWIIACFGKEIPENILP